jgi:hypothetical protein
MVKKKNQIKCRYCSSVTGTTVGCSARVTIAALSVRYIVQMFGIEVVSTVLKADGFFPAHIKEIKKHNRPKTT